MPSVPADDARPANTQWPAAAVALGLIGLTGAVTVVAIRKYQTVAEALQIWTALGAIVGVITGAIITYFFSAKALEESRRTAARAELETDAVLDQLRQRDADSAACLSAVIRRRRLA